MKQKALIIITIVSTIVVVSFVLVAYISYYEYRSLSRRLQNSRSDTAMLVTSARESNSSLQLAIAHSLSEALRRATPASLRQPSPIGFFLQGLPGEEFFVVYWMAAVPTIDSVRLELKEGSWYAVLAVPEEYREQNIVAARRGVIYYTVLRLPQRVVSRVRIAKETGPVLHAALVRTDASLSEYVDLWSAAEYRDAAKEYELGRSESGGIGADGGL